MTGERDPHVLPDADLAALLRGAPWRRIVAIGDSIAEGVREPAPGWRDLSWIDRIAAALPGAEAVNLGRRNLLAHEIRRDQLGEALAYAPDLAIVSAGGNDSLRPSFRPEPVEREVNEIVAALRAAGADVLMLELLDIARSGLVPAEHREELDRRLGALAGLTRAVAERHGAVLVPLRAHPVAADPGVYASDRIHLNARGHAIVASEAVRALAARLVAAAA